MATVNDKGTHLEYVASGTGLTVLSAKLATNNEPSFRLQMNTDLQPSFFVGGGDVSGTEVVRLLTSAGSGQTGMFLLVNQAGTLTAKQVFLGAHDSGGSGYRVLRVLTA
jgi:hypothetical protein